MKTLFKRYLFLLLLPLAMLTNAQVTKFNITYALAPGANNTAAITDGTGKVVWAGFTTIAPDQSTTNEIQTISLSGSTVSLSLGGGSITIPADGDGNSTNEIQTLSIASGVVSLSLGGGSVTLPAEVDGSVSNEIQALSIASGVVSLSLGGGSVTLPDISPTNEIQNLSIATNQLSISSGNTVTIPANMRYVGRQIVAANSSSLTITGFTTTTDTNILIYVDGQLKEGGTGNDWQRTGTTFSFANNPILANSKLVYYEITF